jgi:DNA-directed RNA polymerase subunit K/omega
MTYVPVKDILEHIPNKFESIRVLALECRRLNDRLRAAEAVDTIKTTSRAIENMNRGKVTYFDARERREQERSEAMMAAAEGLLEQDLPIPSAEE